MMLGFVVYCLAAFVLLAMPLPSDGKHIDDIIDPAIASYYDEYYVANGETSLPSSSSDDHPEIPLWPNDKVPGERPGVFGTENWRCSSPQMALPSCTGRHVRNVTLPTLTPFLLPSSDAAVVIAPGGGYNMLAFDSEGTDIAAWLNSIGISAFVLKYRVPGRSWLPFGAAPLMDAQRAMGMVRSMAGGTNLDIPKLNASKIGFMGFSAGGHLSGHLNVAWHNRTYDAVDKADQKPCRPDFSIMVYPWRSVSQPPVNEPISGASALNVTKHTPPTMLIQTEDDPVHVENAIYYYLALKQNGAHPSELHVYPHGGHGYGRCTTSANGRGKHYEVCTWPDRAKVFLKTLGVVKDEEGISIQ